jgi:hypothetical protein
MSRRMVAPGVWVDEGPRESHSTYSAYASRPAATVGTMVPILKGSVVRSPGDIKRNEIRQEKRRVKGWK